MFTGLVDETEALLPPLPLPAAFEKGKQSLPKNKTRLRAKTKMETRAITKKNVTLAEQSNKMLKFGQEGPSLAPHKANRSEIEDLRIQFEERFMRLEKAVRLREELAQNREELAQQRQEQPMETLLS